VTRAAVAPCCRLDFSNPQARSVVITGYRSEMEQLVQKALASGANAVCYKPFEMELLLDTVSF
jgi:DNA-binding NarL/FixJ family response regulator